MNPSNDAPRHEQNPSLYCIMMDCSESFTDRDDLIYHITQSHALRMKPNGASRPNTIPFTNNHVNQAQSHQVPMFPSALLPRNTQNMHHVQSQSAVQNGVQPIHPYPSPQSTLASPNNGQMLPPRNEPPLIADVEISSQNEMASWIETTRWPEMTQKFLKQLAHTYALYASPTNKEDEDKLRAIYSEFYEQTDFRAWKPLKDDARLLQLFKVKLDQIQREMLLKGETIKTSDGTIKRVDLTSTMVTTTNCKSPETLANRPATPIMDADKCRDGVELWNGLDVDGQATLFRHMLRSAKNCKGLMLEWNEYCREVKEKKEQRKEQKKEHRVKSHDPKSTTPSASSHSSKSPPAAPASLRAGKLDVKAIIAKKIRELEMKSDSDSLQAGEERASKRPRSDPL